MMKKINRGKQFEGEFIKGITDVKMTSIDRLIDPMGGYLGVGNICDFIIYQNPFQYYFECKSTTKGVLNFTNDISNTQWEGLIQKSYYPGVTAGFVIWFISFERVIFVPASEMLKIRKLGHASLKLSDVDKGLVDIYNVPMIIKRVLPKIKTLKFLEMLADNYTDWRWIPIE